MDDHREQKASQMKSTEGCVAELKRLSVSRRGEQIDGVPDASLLQKTVEAGEHGHGRTSSEPAFDSRRDRICLEWQQGTRELRCYRQPFDLRSSTCSSGGQLFNFNRLFLLLRQQVTKPTDSGGNSQGCSHDADRSARNETCEHQRDAKCQDYRPSCR